MDSTSNIINNNCSACTQRSLDIQTGIKQVSFFGGVLSLLMFPRGFPIIPVTALATNQNAELIERSIFRRECTHRTDTGCSDKDNLITQKDQAIDNDKGVISTVQPSANTALGDNGETVGDSSLTEFNFLGDGNLTEIFT